MGPRLKGALVAALFGAWWWREKQAKALPAAPGGVDDPNSRITLSMYARANGRCFRVDVRADGSRTSTPVADGMCDATTDLTEY